MMAENELYELLEIMFRTLTNSETKPLPKAGGHPEEMFINLSEEQREQLECAICYQILKEVRECVNGHRFCNSCIDVWSKSGSAINHSRCPVCRSPGYYVSNEELDERINDKLVKCSLASCRWKGKLKNFGTHQHSTYSSTRASNEITTDLPSVRSHVQKRPTSNSRIPSNSSGLPKSITSSDTVSRINLAPQRQPQPGNQSNSNNVGGSSNSQATSSVTQQGPERQNNGPTTSRTRTHNRSRHNSSSPQRRSNITTTGLTNRLTSRARIQNGVVSSESRNIATYLNSEQVENTSTTEQATTEIIMLPHPPTTSLIQRQTPRRLPTLPVLMSHHHLSSAHVTTDDNNNVRETDIDADVMSPDIETPRNRFAVDATIGRPWQPRSFGMIRERLNESRQRLDMLMSAFSNELDWGRHNRSVFQEEREQRRQEQMAEVRDLGRRLTQVTQELRGLLSQRHEIRTQIDSLVESASDDQNEY